MIQDVPTKHISSAVLKEDTRKPNEKRLDEIINQNDDMIVELQKMNKNLATVGQALLKMVENKSTKVKKTS